MIGINKNNRGLVVLAWAVSTVVLLLPIFLIFSQALSAGWAILWANISADYMLHALSLTLLMAVLSVPLNTLFGIAVAWLFTHYEFRGKSLLSAFIDIPYAVSPVVAGLCYLVMYGVESRFGQWLSQHDIMLMFAWPGMLMVTVFVTVPYVARILIPFMQIQGSDEEEAALTLGASGWQIFRRVTLPRIQWTVLYGVILSNARAIGEFGAVSVVSGMILNQTLTLPLLVEQLNNDYKTVAAFTAAALLVSIAMLAVLGKRLVAQRIG